MKKNWLILNSVLLSVAVVFSSVVFFQLTNWDDNYLVTENALVRSLSSANIRSIFQTPVLGTYVPLTVLSFALEYQLVGYEPFLYHLDNLFLHLAVTALSFLLARRVGLSAVAAGIAAFIFGVHPLHVEAVAWVSARKDVLSAVFYLAAIVMYGSFLRTGKWRLYWAMVGLGTLSMLAKPMAVSLPAILFLLDWYNGRSWRRGIVDKLPLVVILGALATITLFSSQKVLAPVGHVTGGAAVLALSWNVIFYLSRFLWPTDLSPVYELPAPVAVTNPVFFFSLLFGVGLLTVVCSRRLPKLWLFAVGFYLLSIWPVLRYGMIYDVGMVADRFMYLPSLGLCLAGGQALERFWLGTKSCSIRRSMSLAGIIVVAGILLAQTNRQIKIWRDGATLWESVLQRQPFNVTANINLADYLLKKGQADERVIALCQRVLQVDPDFAKAHTNLCSVYGQRGRLGEAVVHGRRAVQLNPDDAVAQNNLGAALLAQGQSAEAKQCLQRALDLGFSSAGVYLNLGIANLRLGDRVAAERVFEKAVAMDPSSAVARQFLQRTREEKQSRPFLSETVR